MVHKKEKVYVDMTVLHSKDGTITPIMFVWTDGMLYHIESIIDNHFWRTNEDGSRVYMYKCIIKGQTKILFLKGNRWYLEV